MDAYTFKKKKKPSVGVELRGAGDPHRSEKLGWSAGDMRQWPNQKMHRHPVSPAGVLLLVFWLVQSQQNKKQPSQEAAISNRYYRMIKIN